MALAFYEDTIFQTDTGRAYSGVAVSALSGGIPVQLYRDQAGTDPAAQINSDANGYFYFWVEEGDYDLQYNVGGVILPDSPGAVAIYNLTRDSDLAAVTGAEKVGVATGQTLQEFLDTLDQASTQKANASALGVVGSDTDMGTFAGSTIPDGSTGKGAIQAVETAVETKATAAAVGIAATDVNLGTFTGTTIPDNQTAKQAIQALETAIETIPNPATKANATALGVAATANDMGTFTGTTIPDASTTKAALQALETGVEGRLSSSSNLSDLANAGTARSNLGLAYASQAEAIAASATDRTSSPARVRDTVERATFALDQMLNAETMAAIINRTGVTPQMLGAQPSDTNHSSFIQAAYDRIVTNGGGILWLPAISGDWKVGTRINCYSASLDQCASIRGVGNLTRVKNNLTSGSIFKVGDGTSNVSKFNARDLYLYSAVTRTGGYDFDIQKASQCSIENIITDGSFGGINAEYVNALRLSGIKINSLLSGGAGYRLYANPATGRCDEIFLEDITVQGRNKGINGLVIDGAVNVVRGERVYLLGVNRGLHTTNSAGSGAVPFNLRFMQFEVDRAMGNAAVLDYGTDITFDQPDIANTSGAAAEPPGAAQGNADGAAFVAGSNVQMLRVLNGRVGNCRNQALDIQASDVLIMGNRLHDMAKAGAGTAAAIYLGSNARRVNIWSNRIEGYSRASYAVQAENAVTGAIRDNNYTGMVSGFSAYGGSGISFDNNDSF